MESSQGGPRHKVNPLEMLVMRNTGVKGINPSFGGVTILESISPQPGHWPWGRDSQAGEPCPVGWGVWTGES